MHFLHGIQQGVGNKLPMLLPEVEATVGRLHVPAGVHLGTPSGVAQEFREDGLVERHVYRGEQGAAFGSRE